ncbi:MAG TPA: hypothetical protein VMY35_03710 [Phycisphaerae bacterium]|nr:hypothetical protein [Phycisphaerae bacterium]
MLEFTGYIVVTVHNRPVTVSDCAFKVYADAGHARREAKWYDQVTGGAFGSPHKVVKVKITEIPA